MLTRVLMSHVLVHAFYGAYQVQQGFSVARYVDWRDKLLLEPTSDLEANEIL